jgi:hypothetical protein
VQGTLTSHVRRLTLALERKMRPRVATKLRLQQRKVEDWGAAYLNAPRNGIVLQARPRSGTAGAVAASKG